MLFSVFLKLFSRTNENSPQLNMTYGSAELNHMLPRELEEKYTKQFHPRKNIGHIQKFH